MKKALLAVLVYVLISQLLAFAIAIAITKILWINTLNGIPISILAPSMAVSIIIAILVCWKGLKVMRIPETFHTPRIKWSWALMAIVACILGDFSGNLLTEIVKLPDLLKNDMVELINNNWGILVATILAPISEELIFREGVCGYLARNGMDPVKAIWVSAVLFGLIHGNPAQVFIAMLVGLMLGVIYIKTGNIVLTSIIHILNNAFAVTQMRLLGNKADDFSMVEWVGGYAVAGICIVVGLALSFCLLKILWNGLSPNPSPVGEGDLSVGEGNLSVGEENQSKMNK